MLLAEGIGDTIRVSLSAPPVEEVKVDNQILESLVTGGDQPVEDGLGEQRVTHHSVVEFSHTLWADTIVSTPVYPCILRPRMRNWRRWWWA